MARDMDNGDSSQQGRNIDDCFHTFLLVFMLFGISVIRVGFSDLSSLKFWPADDIKIAVTDDSFTEFNIISPNNYNLHLNISLRNPNKYSHIYYEKALVVVGYYNTSAMASIAGFHQPAKNTTLLTPSFKLQHDNITDDAAARSGKVVSPYDILVMIHLPIKTFK